jgi:hypothetical protein
MAGGIAFAEGKRFTQSYAEEIGESKGRRFKN